MSKNELNNQVAKALARMDGMECTISEYDEVYSKGAKEAKKFIIQIATQMADQIPTTQSVFEAGQADGIRWLIDRLKELDEQ